MQFFILLFIISLYGETSPRFLVFGGKTGWIGQKIIGILQQQGFEAIASQSRIENREEVERELTLVNPHCVINAAGVTGKPNIDWCEDHKVETLRSNIIGALNLADLTYSKNIHMINIGTGCIYEYDVNHALGSGIGFKENDIPNFTGSFYSHTKGMLDRLMQNYTNVLNLRIRMPISSDLHPRNFITKITTYKKVINIPNSMSVLDDLLPLISQMHMRGLTGNLNFVNPGVISHNEILDFYKKYLNPEFHYENFTIEEQNQILKAKRSNNELDTCQLLKEFPTVPNIKSSVESIFIKMSPKKEADEDLTL